MYSGAHSCLPSCIQAFNHTNHRCNGKLIYSSVNGTACRNSLHHLCLKLKLVGPAIHVQVIHSNIRCYIPLVPQLDAAVAFVLGLGASRVGTFDANLELLLFDYEHLRLVLLPLGQLLRRGRLGGSGGKTVPLGLDLVVFSLGCSAVPRGHGEESW